MKCIVGADAIGEASEVRQTAGSLDKQLVDDCWLVLLRVTVTHSGCLADGIGSMFDRTA